MKLQFSLRTLIILCVVAGLGVWFGVHRYLESSDSPELDIRYKTIGDLVDEAVSKREQEYRLKIGYAGYSNGTSHLRGINTWEIHGDCTADLGKEKVRLISLRAKCSRKQLDIQPIEIEYDNAVGNDELVQKVKALCEKKEWRFAVKKVE